MMSALIGPNGQTLKRTEVNEGLVFCNLDRNDPELEISLTKARPWRAIAGTGEFYADWLVTDSRSTNKTCL